MPETLPALRSLDYRVTQVDAPTPDIRIFRLEPKGGEPLRFLAGQYLRLAFKDWPQRPYSIASRPDEPLLEIHIRGGGGGTSHALTDRLDTGDMVQIEGPFGHAHLRDKHAGPILAVAGGSGLAPMKSIVETALKRGFDQPTDLYFGVRERRDLYFQDHFAALSARHPNLRFVPVVMEKTGGALRQGLVTDALAQDLGNLDGVTAYLAGPPPMIAATRKLLLERGLPSERIHCDDGLVESTRATRE